MGEGSEYTLSTVFDTKNYPINRYAKWTKRICDMVAKQLFKDFSISILHMHRVIIWGLPLYTRAMIHASCDPNPPPRGDNIRAVLHESYDTRELRSVAASSGS